MLGAVLSGAYLYPAIIEQHLIHSDLLNGKILYEYTYLQGINPNPPGAFHDFIELLNQIWVINVAVFSLGVLLFLILRRSNKEFENEKAHVIIWTVAGFFSSFMMLSASDNLRNFIPKLEIGVFSWRFLSISSFITALIFGICVQAARNALAMNTVKRRWMRVVASVLLLAFIGFSIARVIFPMHSFQNFTPEKEHLNSIMIPATVTLKPRDLPLISVAGFAQQSGQIVVEQWKPQSRRIMVTLPLDDQLIVRTFNFPGWAAKVDGQPTAIGSHPEHGAIDIPLTAGSHIVQLEFIDTPARQFGNILTLLAFVTVLSVMAIALLRSRRSVTQPQPQIISSESKVELIT